MTTQDTTQEQYYAAAIGTDGINCVVWGAGTGDDLDEATNAASVDSQDWLEEANNPEHASIEVVQIDRARFERITSGDVDANDLMPGALRHAYERG
jgi:hypothetical protein